MSNNHSTVQNFRGVLNQKAKVGIQDCKVLKQRRIEKGGYDTIYEREKTKGGVDTYLKNFSSPKGSTFTWILWKRKKR